MLVPRGCGNLGTSEPVQVQFSLMRGSMRRVKKSRKEEKMKKPRLVDVTYHHSENYQGRNYEGRAGEKDSSDFLCCLYRLNIEKG